MCIIFFNFFHNRSILNSFRDVHHHHHNISMYHFTRFVRQCQGHFNLFIFNFSCVFNYPKEYSIHFFLMHSFTAIKFLHYFFILSGRVFLWMNVGFLRIPVIYLPMWPSAGNFVYSFFFIYFSLQCGGKSFHNSELDILTSLIYICAGDCVISCILI